MLVLSVSKYSDHGTIAARRAHGYDGCCHLERICRSVGSGTRRRSTPPYLVIAVVWPDLALSLSWVWKFSETTVPASASGVASFGLPFGPPESQWLPEVEDVVKFQCPLFRSGVSSTEQLL